MTSFHYVFQEPFLTFVVRGCPVYGRTSNRIPGLYSWDTGETPLPPGSDNQKCPQIRANISWRMAAAAWNSLVDNHWSRVPKLLCLMSTSNYFLFFVGNKWFPEVSDPCVFLLQVLFPRFYFCSPYFSIFSPSFICSLIQECLLSSDFVLRMILGARYVGHQKVLVLLQLTLEWHVYSTQ